MNAGAEAVGGSLVKLASGILVAVRARGARIVTAESCTGGLVASLLTDVPGASDVMWGGLVTYQGSAKRELLGVSAETLATHTEVSLETARTMAQGALARLPSGPGYAVATTGNAGPTGEPVGLVWIAVASRGVEPHPAGEKLDASPRTNTYRYEFDPALGREGLKAAFARAALDSLAQALAQA